MTPEQKYWLSDLGGPWYEVTRREYLAAERWAGFNAPVGQLATTTFASEGRVLRGTTIDPAKMYPGEA